MARTVAVRPAVTVIGAVHGALAPQVRDVSIQVPLAQRAGAFHHTRTALACQGGVCT